MTNIKQFVIDYIEGRVPSKDFINILWQDDSIFEWLQSIVPEGMIGYYDIVSSSGETQEVICPYDVKRTVEKLINLKGGTRLGKELDIHYEISQLLIKALPNESIKEDKTLEKKFNFLLDACPDYIDGEEVNESEILERLLNELPEGLNKKQRIKLFKEKIKAEFHVEGQKYPRWIQGGEWPYSNGKPMRYLGQKSKAKGEYYEYYFEDIETKERRTVTQFM